MGCERADEHTERHRWNDTEVEHCRIRQKGEQRDGDATAGGGDGAAPDDRALVFVGTSVASFLLIGHYQDEDGQYAARKSMLITVSGGLFMLVGWCLRGEPADD